MRLVPEANFTSYGEGSYETDETEYPEMTYPSEQNMYGPPLRRLRPGMERPPMVRPPMPRGVPPRGIPPRMPMPRLMGSRPPTMMTRPAPVGAQQRAGRGYPLQPRIENRLGSRFVEWVIVLQILSVFCFVVNSSGGVTIP